MFATDSKSVMREAFRLKHQRHADDNHNAKGDSSPQYRQ
jgi:hypothetical protein